VTFSIHAALWNRTWADDVAPFVHEAAELGYDAVEVSLLGDDAGFARVARVAREAGVRLTCTTGLSAATDVGSADPSVRAAGRAALERAVRSAETLGSRLLSGVVYGAWGVVDPARREERLALATEALAGVAPLAADVGVTLGIEAINRYETDLVNTADQALALVGAIGAPNVGVLMDAYHMNIEEKDPAAALRRCGAHLVHLHVAGRDRGVPEPATLERFGLREALHDLGYQGTITCEMFVQAHVPVSADLTVWRAIEPDPSDAARRALAALRAWWR
jgi:D-psicose/D-tagatose/L-ribulose 3-epimerase